MQTHDQLTRRAEASCDRPADELPSWTRNTGEVERSYQPLTAIDSSATHVDFLDHCPHIACRVIARLQGGPDRGRLPSFGVVIGERKLCERDRRSCVLRHAKLRLRRPRDGTATASSRCCSDLDEVHAAVGRNAELGRRA